MSAFELVRAEADNFPVNLLCRLLGVSTSGYYAWLNREPSQWHKTELRLCTKIRAIHAANDGVYGSRRMTAEIDERVGRHRVARVMREHGLQARRPRRYRVTTDSAHDRPVAPNLLARHFCVDAPNRVWAGDITYVWTAEGWSYLAVQLDLYSRRVVGWAFAEHMRTELPLTALRRALQKRQPAAGLIHHSDRGSQYASGDYQKLLRQHEVACSMSRAGDCYDNSVVESFFATLKKERLHRRHFATRTEAYDAIASYIDGFYNPVRRHSVPGYVSPLQYENTESFAQAA
jgi:putative transposase